MKVEILDRLEIDEVHENSLKILENVEKSGNNIMRFQMGS